MASNQLSDLSIPELQNKIKQFKTFNYVFIALALLYVMFMFSQMYLGTFNMGVPQIVIPIVVFIGYRASEKQQEEIRTEIKNRQSV
ncbi:MAG: hypothetical protein AB8H47_19580 [Bacteroidia bacterium]